jgi:hypothetical protein
MFTSHTYEITVHLSMYNYVKHKLEEGKLSLLTNLTVQGFY